MERKKAIHEQCCKTERQLEDRTANTPPMIREMNFRQTNAFTRTKEGALQDSLNNLGMILKNQVEKRKDKSVKNPVDLDFICRLQDRSRAELSRQIKLIRLKANQRLIAASNRNGQLLISDQTWLDKAKEDQEKAENWNTERNLEADKRREKQLLEKKKQARSI